MTDTLPTVLLLALPASGKSEVRRYLAGLSPETCRDDFHMGSTVQLDDFPYVHLMRRVDQELDRLGRPRVFFQAADRPFLHGTDWGTLIELLNEDYEDLVQRQASAPASTAAHLLERFDAASEELGGPVRFRTLPDELRGALSDRLEAEVAELYGKLAAAHADSLAGRTLVIEFARGGPQGATMPLRPPYGYRYSLGRLATPILEQAVILYIWVTPEESRRKNEARSDPDDPGSILHHGVPHEVMMQEYGCDDIDWLEAQAARPGTVTIEAHGRSFHIPIARFDNRVDKTSFIRAPRENWRPEDVAAVHAGLQEALGRLQAARHP